MQSDQWPKGTSSDIKDGGTALPAYTRDFGTRLGSIVDLVGGQKAAARIAGVTPAQLAKWRSGKARMPFGAAVALCLEASESLDWLATGEREPLRGGARTEERLDDIGERLDQARQMFDKAVKAVGWEPPPVVAENFRSLLVGAKLNRLDVEHVAQLLDAMKRWQSSAGGSR